MYYVYMLTNKTETVLYVGVTNSLVRRCKEHKLRVHPSFTAKYRVDRLIYYEEFKYILDAIKREKQLKGKTRAKKELLIVAFNPTKKELCVENEILRP